MHTSVKEQHTKVLATEQVEAELVDFSSAEAENAKAKMVVQRNMIIDWFLPGGCLKVQQQQPLVTTKGLDILTSLREGLKRLL
nr:hypothetical protein CFP56_54200 [Quercus suber]